MIWLSGAALGHLHLGATILRRTAKMSVTRARQGA